MTGSPRQRLKLDRSEAPLKAGPEETKRQRENQTTVEVKPLELEYGAQVIDKNGKKLGMIDYIVRDTYTGDIKKFKVNTELVETDLFYSPEDVSEASPTQVKLKTAFNQPD